MRELSFATVNTTHEPVSFPKEAPEIRLVAVAERKPTSARLNVNDRAAFCQLMTTRIYA